MKGIRYVEITSEEARALYNQGFEILKVKHFKGGIETTFFNKDKDGKKLFLRLGNIIDYMVREDIYQSFYGVD